MRGFIFPFPKKIDLENTKNCSRISLRPAKDYTALLFNDIKPEIDKIFNKNQNQFRKNCLTAALILTIRRIVEEENAKDIEETLFFVYFSKAFDSIHRGKVEQIF